MMSAPSRCIGVMALLMTCRLVQCQTAAAFLEHQFKRADSAFSVLLERPETRMKEIAPVEDLFRALLAERPEFVTVLRTNSKGQIVNTVSSGDSAYGKNTDVSSKEWYGVPQESRRPYYGPIIQENQKSFLFWSKPIFVRNSLGLSRFGGVIAAKVSLPGCFKLFAARFQGPFEILFKGREFYYHSWDEHARYEEKIVRIPGVSGLTARFIDKKQTPEATPAHFDSTAVSKTVADKTTETKDSAVGTEAGLLNTSAPSVPSVTPAAPLKRPAHNFIEKNIGLGLAGTIVIVAVFIASAMMSRQRKKRKSPVEEAQADIVSGSGLAKELDDAIRQSLDNEARQNDRPPEIEEKARADLLRELKKEVSEKEADMIRNNVRAEMKEEIRLDIRNNEAQAIRAIVEKELTDSWREEIKSQHQETIRERELENLKKIVQEKLLEKEMPLLVETYRKELVKEIRQKTIDTFSDQIEKIEREELIARMKAKVQEDAESVRIRLREEMIAKIRQELEEQECGVLKNSLREELKKRIQDETIEKDLPGIRDDILRRVSDEEHSRVNDQERPGIIEAERNRLREHESPGLREEIRAKLREEEIEAMHARVKTEIYTETVQALKAGLEEKYKDVLEKKLEEYKEVVEKRARGEIKGRIRSEYQNLIEHIERLSLAMGNV